MSARDRGIRPALLCAALVTIGAGGCASGGGIPASADGPEGCYQLAPAAGLGLPFGVQLVDAPLEGWSNLPEARVAWTLRTPDQLTDNPFGFWAPAMGDSIRIGHPGGGGVTLIVQATGAGLAGRGIAAGDALLPNQSPLTVTATVTAQRVSCPAE